MQSLIDKLPRPVRQRAESIGEPGTQWLAELDDISNEIAANWHLTVAAPLSGGSESLILPATCEDGTEAILKIGMPTVCDTAKEAEILELVDGRGYVRLLNKHAELNAILVEKLGTALADLQLSTDEQIEIICNTLKPTWVAPPDSHGLMTGAEKAQWLATFIDKTWLELDKPCAQETRNLALTFAQARGAAFAPETSVLIHGDAHETNTLRAPDGEDFKFIDPDGLFAEPACDLAVPMRGWGSDLLAGDAVELGQARCEFIAGLTGVDKIAIWQWGFMERVSTGLVLRQIGMYDEATEYLKVADLWVNADFNI